MQGTSCKMPGWMKHKLESRSVGEISRRRNNLRYTDDTTLIAESEEELEYLNESERGERKCSLKTKH